MANKSEVDISIIQPYPDNLVQPPDGYSQSPEALAQHLEMARLITMARQLLEKYPNGRIYSRILDFFVHINEIEWPKKRFMDELCRHLGEKNRRKVSLLKCDFKKRVKAIIGGDVDVEAILTVMAHRRKLAKSLLKKRSNKQLLADHFPPKRTVLACTTHYGIDSYPPEKRQALIEQYSQPRVSTTMHCHGRSCPPNFLTCCPCSPPKNGRKRGPSDSARKAVNERPKPGPRANPGGNSNHGESNDDQ